MVLQSRMSVSLIILCSMLTASSASYAVPNNKDSQSPYPVLEPGSRVVAGDPQKNEFYILGRGEPDPVIENKQKTAPTIQIKQASNTVVVDTAIDAAVRMVSAAPVMKAKDLMQSEIVINVESMTKLRNASDQAVDVLTSEPKDIPAQEVVTSSTVKVEEPNIQARKKIAAIVVKDRFTQPQTVAKNKPATKIKTAARKPVHVAARVKATAGMKTISSLRKPRKLANNASDKIVTGIAFPYP